MKLVIFGLAVSSTWGNGHAALWRGLIAALLRDGHRVTFFERDVPYYAGHRDLAVLPAGPPPTMQQSVSVESTIDSGVI